MKPDPQPSGLSHGIHFLINPEWTPQQALAVFELLNDLADSIWSHYGVQLQEQQRSQTNHSEIETPRPRSKAHILDTRRPAKAAFLFRPQAPNACRRLDALLESHQHGPHAR
ncbi:MAG: hypothetical protein E5X37_32115 [Mesorhizobium sp.]|uniref:hypothetical protein n=1 Tax=Mesorhizobium sp. TaxID=1871066 RepID=UPI00121A09B7|nr:hypothetical protein [Mesorhizobium sp.]TIR03456.1 MAG: hypothetical protein E5X37_32115 [Mesorhizobium sp.]